MTKVETHARAVQQARIAASIDEAAPFDVARARDALYGAGMTATSLVVFATLRALCEDDAAHHAYMMARAKVVRERDLDVSMELGKAGFR